MRTRRLIVIILTVCMIVTYMPVTGYAYADDNTDQLSEPDTPNADVIDMSSDTEPEDISTIPDSAEKAALRSLTGDEFNEALASYLSSENAENDILEDKSGLDYNTYDLGDGMKAKVFFSYPVRYEDKNGERSISLAYVGANASQRIALETIV